MYKYLFIAIACLYSTTCIAQQSDVKMCKPRKNATNVYFKLGSSILTNATINTIDSLFYNDVLNTKRRVAIVGYADVLGESTSNNSLAEQRAEAVYNYIISMGVDSAYIQIFAGGEVQREKTVSGYPEDRKVTIVPGEDVKPEKVIMIDSGTLIATVNFEFYSIGIIPNSMPVLDTVVKILKAHPGMKVLADGYVCCIHFGCCKDVDVRESGMKEEEFRIFDANRLSSNRANVVFTYLTTHGIDKSRIKCNAYGYQRTIIRDGKKIHGNRVEILASTK
ncbi:MAG: OmpA family protein [Bacteroidetes bacterium]|nr:OmpA family protein [Bacteroidota bacterium]